MLGRPFENFSKLWVIAPSDFSVLNEADALQSKEVQRLIEEHKNGIGRELGCSLEFTTNTDIEGAKWLIGPLKANPSIQQLGFEHASGPQIYLDRKKGLLVTDGSTSEEVMETFSWLRSLHKRQDGLWKIETCSSTDEAVERIFEEVQSSFPAFDSRNLNWKEISDHHIPLVRSAADPIAAMQRWLAELGDSHTWIRPNPPYGNFPYDLFTQDNTVLFYRISETSKAWQLGVRPGFELLDQNAEDWFSRTSASSHAKPFVVGARMLATKFGTKRSFVAKSPEGKLIKWEEEPVTDRWSPLVKWKVLPSGNAYLRIEAWLAGKNLEEDIDLAIDQFQNSPKLIVDLRSNPGGNLLMAHRFRNRFLKQTGPVGWIKTTLPNGQLSEKESIDGELVSKEKRWTKQVVFLTDPLTYSAGEDAVLGLQGQSNVKVIGLPSGGGSGRVRILRLLEGWRLTISTALTFDLAGNCIEGRGIRVDEISALSFEKDVLIEKADKLNW